MPEQSFQNLSVDYIIVGQGLAGSTLAIQLIKAKKKILVMDNVSSNRCSVIAAGLFNPVTGKKLMKTWLADRLFPYLFNFYMDAEKITGGRFFFPMKIYRPFVNLEEQNEWMGRSSDAIYNGILEKVNTNPTYKSLNDKLGGIELKQSGYVDTRSYISAVRGLLLENKQFADAQFQYSDLVIGEEGVSYLGCHAKKIVFCEGTGVDHNPWFRDIKLRPLKGEVLHIKSELDEQVIVNRGVYVVPSGTAGQYRVGSTYQAAPFTMGVTTEAKIEMTEKLKALIASNFDVTKQEWGIRPTTTDRKPVLGTHPVYYQMAVYNGLGTKGVSLAPYFSEQLFQWLEMGIPLNNDVDVTRYKLLY
jgi:glycine oxidase